MGDSSLDMFIGRKVMQILGIQPTLAFDDGGFLTIECSWRLRDRDSILLGCTEDERELAQPTISQLSEYLLNREIISIQLIPPVSDLVINFNSDLILELFSNSSAFENWTLSNGKGFERISGRAGDYIIING